MPGYLAGKVVVVIGLGDDAQRAVAVSLAQGGADVAIAGAAADLPAEAALHSISNEVWAIGRRSTVATLIDGDATSFAGAINRVTAELGRVDLIVHCDPVRMA